MDPDEKRTVLPHSDAIHLLPCASGHFDIINESSAVNVNSDVMTSTRLTDSPYTNLTDDIHSISSHESWTVAGIYTCACVRNQVEDLVGGTVDLVA